MAGRRIVRQVLCVMPFVCCYIHITCSSVMEINLGGTWIVQNANKSISVPGEVPGNVHTALYRDGTIMNPYFRFNDINYRWIAYDNWTYSRTIEVSDVLLSKRQVLLVFEGLDTVATVLVNGITVGHSANMFRRYIFSVKKVLKTGSNLIEVCFTSAILYAKEQAKKSPYDVPPDCPVPVQHGECHGNFIRKEQSSFSWDWGPAFVPQGIWRNVSLQAYNSAVIRDITVTSTKVNSVNVTWQLSVAVFIDAASDGVPGTLNLNLPQLARSLKFALKLSQGLQRVSLPVMTFSKKDDVKAWWPRGYGKQSLYTVKVVFSSSSGEEQSSISRKIGFRKVILQQERINGSSGLGFHFEINDLPIFLKGANWIPADAFEDRVTSSVLRNLLQSAVDANMNVLRNWGGGIYQHDEFYSIADELGLLVWEEFMFACSLYPTDENFLNSVKEEVRYQVRRLHYHPSVFVWSGNNEIEGALADGWYNISSKFAMYVKDYVELFINTIKDTLEEKDKSRPFLSSSPSNGVETEREGWVAKDPNSVFWGDVHYYNYENDCWNVDGYPKPRFASEYGFQSYPSFETLAEVSLPRDWTFNSSFMKNRQHHGDGNQQMLGQAGMHFKLPNSSDPLKKYKDTLFITQVMQAQCMKTETEHYRRLQSQLINGEGKTMGTIYWQLNSIWQAPTWSSLEYGGRWKMLHYFAKNFYATVIASPYVKGGKFKLYVISDLTKPIVKGAVSLKAWAWSSFKPLSSKNVTFNIHPQSSKLVYSEDLKTLIETSRCVSSRHCVITTTPADLSTGQNLGPTNVFYPTSLSQAVGLNDPHLKVVKVRQNSKAEFSVSIQAQSPACFVWLVAKDVRGRFSENGFLLTEPSKTVLFYSWQETTASDLEKSLYVKSLYDLYT
ncbi:beta-mannosidase-like [Montipora foliosa]|uniref:beta-mannosidase-like n=1 Tax=Montipora foliosa TaxID=591990 RepID=UPI0035F15161